MSIGHRLVEVFEEDGVQPLFLIGIDSRGVFKFVAPPFLRKLLADHPALRQRLGAEVARILEKFAVGPLDDLTIKG